MSDEIPSEMREKEWAILLKLEEAAKGIENALCWHALATWTNEGRARIGYFARALACVESGRDARLRPRDEVRLCNDAQIRTDCLYEIGRVQRTRGTRPWRGVSWGGR